MTVFLPVLNLTALLLLSRSRGRENLDVYCDGLPRYMRGICRVTGLAPEKMVRLVSRLTRLKIQKIPGYDKIGRFHQIHLAAMEKVTAITRDLLPWVEAGSRIGPLRSLIGAGPALAFTAKCLGMEIFPPLLSVAAACEVLGTAGFTVVWDPGWPQAWRSALHRHLGESESAFFAWPIRYQRILALWTRVKVLGQLPAVAASFLWRRGLSWKPVSKRKAKIITEFIDPKRLQGTAYDADYLIDGQVVKKEDVVFFLSRYQSRMLHRNGCRAADLAALFHRKSYHLRFLEKLPYPAGVLGNLLSFYIKTAKTGLRDEAPFLGRVFTGAWREYLEYAPLFAHYQARHFIYPTFPNGNTSIRRNDAVITGLCRQNGIKSVGCQTRSIYSTKFEDCFDCYDLYLSWGPAWRERLPARMEFVERVADVGCIYLDHLLPALNSRQRLGSFQDKVVVAVFDTDISYNHHYTRSYMLSFMKNCAELARRYPECHFLVKNKDPIYAKIIMADKEFRGLLGQLNGNLEFASRQRYDYAEVMAQADIVIAIAFTTPGVEGLLLGKPALYYSEFQCGGQAFSGAAGLVVRNFQELEQGFARSLARVRQGYVPDESFLDELSTFRDGRVRSRIVQILEG